MAKKKGPGGNGDEPVGYGKPPKSTQFRPGISGNPLGRRKRINGTRPALSEMQRYLSGTVAATEGGKVKNVSRSYALLQKAFGAAMNGNVAAMRDFLKKMDEGDEGAEPEAVVMDLSAESVETLRRYLKRRDEEQDDE